MVMHDQNVDISERIARFYQHLSDLGYEKHAIHAGPLIRREGIYHNDNMEQRKKLFNALFHFVRLIDLHYDCVVIKKTECPDVISLTAKLSKAIAEHLRSEETYWKQFDQIIIYYDNGQIELTKILTSVFNTLFANVEFRKVQPVDYILFQAADLICTLKLVLEKFEGNIPSKSEKEFFISGRDFKKNYVKPIIKKHLP